jgi:hypothetical protein
MSSATIAGPNPDDGWRSSRGSVIVPVPVEMNNVGDCGMAALAP